MRHVLLACCWMLVGLGCELPGASLGESSRGLASEATGTPLRIVAANLTSGNKQSYDLGHGARILQGVKPDVVLIQELKVGDNSPETLSAWLAETFGEGWSVMREEGKGIPNGIISRWPIVESGEWEDPSVADRDFAWARIDVPGDQDLWAVSVHLLTKGRPYRHTQAKTLAARLAETVPEGDLLVVGGDFNSDSASEPCFEALSSQLRTRDPLPVDAKGNNRTNRSRAKPYDQVLVDADLGSLQVPTVVGAASFAHGFVVDTRIHTPLSDLAPAQAGDSAAPNMQHMAVVKDFFLPAVVPVAAP